MSTKLQNFWSAAKIKAGNLTYRATQTLQKYLGRRKWIVGMTAVVLFSLSFTDWSLNTPNRQDLSPAATLIEGLLGPTDQEEIVEKALVIGGNYFGAGGPALAQNAFLTGSGSAAMDLSADDDQEGQEFCLVGQNTLVAPMSPDEQCYFDNNKKETKTYVVRSGDTAESIAFAYGINTYTLLWANDLTEKSIIRPGQELVVLPINGVRVQVKAGDTVQALGKKYAADPQEIIAYNALPADGSLQAGDYLILPGGEMPAPAIKTPVRSAPKYATGTITAGWLIIPAGGYNWGRLHGYNAVDIANKCWTPVYAAAAGTVSLTDEVGWNGGYGKYMKIDHPNGVTTLYAHFNDVIVSAGDSVKQGQLIGYMGTTGRSTGCHVHFEVRGAKNPFARY